MVDRRPIRVVRITRHDATVRQVSELRRIYGRNVVIIKVSANIPNVGKIKEIIEQYKADVIEVVMPFERLAECFLPESGISVPIIRAITTRRMLNGVANFEFSHYVRILKVTLEVERL